MIKFRGLNGTIFLEEEYLLISREKKLDNTFHDLEKKQISYSSIKNIKLVLGGITNGYICIDDSECKIPTNIFRAIKNENTVVFRIFKNEVAEQFVNELRKRILERER